MPSIPSYLIFLIVVIVILPSIITIICRWFLYRRLVFLEERVRRLINENSPGNQPKIVKEIEARFRKASSQLDQINTAALIDQVYSQEKIWRVTYEQIEYLCRIIPNLLLAFGLFGTFLGITINLSELSQTISETSTSNISDLVDELKKPLEGMSIAFTTSLFGLGCSALVTLFNFFLNTNIIKYRLISSLEDYLDNIYHPQVQGDTRLDKIVKKMVSQQDEFLTRFGETVRDAVDKSLGRVAKEIAQGNKEAADLAKQVYERFAEASGTISAAATEFEHAIAELNAKSHIFIQSAEIFEKSQFPDKLSAAMTDLASTQEKFSQSAATLAQTVSSIDIVVTQIQRCSEELIGLGAGIKIVNQTAITVLNSHQENQISLSEIIPQLKQGAGSFSRAITKLEKLENKIVDKADSLNEVENALKELLQTLKLYTEEVNLEIGNIGDHLINNLSEQMGSHNQKIQIFINNFEGYINQFIMKTDTFKIDLMELIQTNYQKSTSESQNINTLLVGKISQQTEINQQLLQTLIQYLQKYNTNENSKFKQEIENLEEKPIPTEN
ncbi:MAG: hypothetical protein KME21_05685 [Desmonostoc vinosum HA7617-LM4]|jgi:ABC-type transporter Mla subunit MlaD|nr:hypothetical protein [Desmonostoc vinosum HA7617-LM4]